MSLKDSYRDCLEHIESSWSALTFSCASDDGFRVGMPNAYVSPSAHIFGGDQFYWDSYFTILGLLDSGRIKLAQGMVENLCSLFERFGLIPARNRFYNLGISQPPFLSSMALEIYAKTRQKKWLRSVADVVEKELNTYWMRSETAEHHLAYRGLSRYCDHFVTHLTAEHESGWDMTSRFSERCLNYLPVDLNACLFKYEMDLEKICRILGRRVRAELYKQRAEARSRVVKSLMWDSKRQFFFDYIYTERRRSTFHSLAGFYPIWAGMVSKVTARRMLKSLKRFEYTGGLANTQTSRLAKEYKQWDYPNGWPNQQWIVIKGLLNYGFEEDAKRLGLKWLDLNQLVFRQTGEMWEKYDVVDLRRGKNGRYVTENGFGWTNGVFVRLVSELSNF